MAWSASTRSPQSRARQSGGGGSTSSRTTSSRMTPCRSTARTGAPPFSHARSRTIGHEPPIDTRPTAQRFELAPASRLPPPPPAKSWTTFAHQALPKACSSTLLDCMSPPCIPSGQCDCEAVIQRSFAHALPARWPTSCLVTARRPPPLLPPSTTPSDPLWPPPGTHKARGPAGHVAVSAVALCDERWCCDHEVLSTAPAQVHVREGAAACGHPHRPPVLQQAARGAAVPAGGGPRRVRRQPAGALPPSSSPWLHRFLESCADGG
jgi:hypothetical protein